MVEVAVGGQGVGGMKEPLLNQQTTYSCHK